MTDWIMGSWMSLAAVALLLGVGMVALLESADGSHRPPTHEARARRIASGGQRRRMVPSSRCSGCSSRSRSRAPWARFDNAAGIGVEEANAIGTAYLRLDMVAPDLPARPSRHLPPVPGSARLETYRKHPDMAAANQGWPARSESFAASDLDTGRLRRAGIEPTTAGMLLLPALNQMIDITTTRRWPPSYSAGGRVLDARTLALMSALLAGHGMASVGPAETVHVLGFAIIIAATVYPVIRGYGVSPLRNDSRRRRGPGPRGT